MKAFAVVLLLLLVAILLRLGRKQLAARRLKKRCEQGFTDPAQLAELLDEWNRKHRPDLWSRGGDWPKGEDSKAPPRSTPSVAGQSPIPELPPGEATLESMCPPVSN